MGTPVEALEVEEGLDPEQAGELARRLEEDEGLLLAGPTETVYGLGGPVSPRRIEALSAWKEREGRPFLLLVPGGGGGRGGGEGREPWEEASLAGLVWSPVARRLARRFWPGPLTLALPDPEGRFPPGVRGPEGLVAVRRSPDPVLGPLVEALARPVLSTSANRRGSEPARSGAALLELLEGSPPPVDGRGRTCRWLALLGGGRTGMPSTLVAPGARGYRLLREGAVPVSRMDDALEDLT